MPEWGSAMARTTFHPAIVSLRSNRERICLCVIFSLIHISLRSAPFKNCLFNWAPYGLQSGGRGEGGEGGKGARSTAIEKWGFAQGGPLYVLYLYPKRYHTLIHSIQVRLSFPLHSITTNSSISVPQYWGSSKQFWYLMMTAIKGHRKGGSWGRGRFF